MSRTLDNTRASNGVARSAPAGGASHPAQVDPAGGLRLLRFPAVRARTGLSRSTIWRLQRTGAFPRHVQLSPNTVAWLEDDVTNWIRQKAGRAYGKTTEAVSG
jgi:prophage regulatory protein